MSALWQRCNQKDKFCRQAVCRSNKVKTKIQLILVLEATAFEILLFPKSVLKWLQAGEFFLKLTLFIFLLKIYLISIRNTQLVNMLQHCSRFALSLWRSQNTGDHSTLMSQTGFLGDRTHCFMTKVCQKQSIFSEKKLFFGKIKTKV